MDIKFNDRRAALALLFGMTIIAANLYAANPPIELIEVSEAADPLAVGGCACPDCGGDLGDNPCGHGLPCARCCQGRDVCCPTVEEATEEKSCWKVKCEKVCIPAVRLPWEPGGSKLTLFSWLRHSAKGHCGSACTCAEDCDGCVSSATAGCCAPNCGPVRCVSVLESESYEVKTCRCKWEIRHVPGCCEAKCGGCGETPQTESSADGVLPPPE
ncbi:MAG TPA: hypothetical protein VJ828_01210 [Lacipirellulaceae bacterium]|nr:hypothetical protein [Lacipirellulaceae bacterium]